MSRLAPEDYPRFYEYIYSRVHTPASLQMFI
jgi:hypothetical protein